MRWMSPELIAPEEFGLKTSYPTKSSDCYSLGMVTYEIFSGNVPFHEVSDVAVFLKVVKGERPCCKIGFPEHLQNIMEQCWTPQPNERPSVEDVLEYLEACSSMSVPPPGMDKGMRLAQDDRDDCDVDAESKFQVRTPSPATLMPSDMSTEIRRNIGVAPSSHSGMVFYILLRSIRCLTLTQGSEEESMRRMEESAMVERVEINEIRGKFWFLHG